MRRSKVALVVVLLASLARAESAPQPSWRDVDPNNLVLIDTRYGEVAVELAPAFAPAHAERLRGLIRAGFYDGKTFYRVVDGFVAQGGAGEGTAATGGLTKASKDWPPLRAEFDAPIAAQGFTPLGSPDLYAAEVGHSDGFPVGRDLKEGRMWLIHCPGTFAFARDNDPNSATTEFYIVLGQAPRRLDRDLTAFGRVISGMQYLQKLERGDPARDGGIGVIQDASKRDPIVKMRIAADLPEKDRPHYQVERTETAIFAVEKDARLHPTSPFYYRQPPPILDVCIMPVAVRLAPAPSQ